MTSYVQSVPLPTLGWATRFVTRGTEPAGAPWQVGQYDRLEFFPRGSQAFAIVAQSVARDPERPVCFFPSYFCEGSLKPLRQANARIVFYRVTRSLTPEWEDVRRRAKAEHPDLFVLVHTFGHIQNGTEAQTFKDEVGCVVLEDGAHVLKPAGTLGNGETLVLFSPHKLLALPPISLLSIPPSLAERVRNPYTTAWRRQDWKWLAKRAFQKGLVALGGLRQKVKQQRGGFNGGVDEAPSVIDYPHVISEMGGRLLQAQQHDLKLIAGRRRENFVTLANAVAEFPEVEIPQPLSEWAEDSTPYAFPFFVGQHRVSTVYTALWKMGIPALTWPDLPEEISGQPEEYSDAVFWRKNLLLLPVHQSLTSRQMNRMVSSLKRVLAASPWAEGRAV